MSDITKRKLASRINSVGAVGLGYQKPRAGQAHVSEAHWNVDLMHPDTSKGSDGNIYAVAKKDIPRGQFLYTKYMLAKHKGSPPLGTTKFNL